MNNREPIKEMFEGALCGIAIGIGIFVAMLLLALIVNASGA